MRFIRGVVLMTAVYLALTANFQPSNILIGLVLAGVIMLLLRYPSEQVFNWRFTPGGFIATGHYVLILIYDLMVSGIQVARLVLDPALPVRQGNIAIPTTCATEPAQALSAHAITVTPGEMVVEIDAYGTMYTHVLDATHAEEDIVRAQSMREEMLDKIAV